MSITEEIELGYRVTLALDQENAGSPFERYPWIMRRLWQCADRRTVIWMTNRAA
jgi:hypothetical protein